MLHSAPLVGCLFIYLPLFLHHLSPVGLLFIYLCFYSASAQLVVYLFTSVFTPPQSGWSFVYLFIYLYFYTSLSRLGHAPRECVYSDILLASLPAQSPVFSGTRTLLSPPVSKESTKTPYTYICPAYMEPSHSDLGGGGREYDKDMHKQFFKCIPSFWIPDRDEKTEKFSDPPPTQSLIYYFITSI